MISFSVILALLSSFHLVNALNFTSSTFPPISYTSDSVSNYSFSLKHPVQITLGKEDASKTDINDPDGLSLIPPTLQTFVSGFRTDLKELLESTTTLYRAFDSISSKDEISSPNVDFNLVESAPKWTSERRDKPLRIHFSLIKLDSDLLKDPKLHYLASPSNSSKASHEAYILNITSQGIEVQGVGVRGAWWASRILLQELALSISSNEPSKSNFQISTLRSGTSFNSPSYPTRGLMLDAGRHWYSKSFLKDFCSYLSFFSINEFHYHLSDHYPLNRGPINTTEDLEGWKKVYSHFSLKSNNTDEAKDQPALSKLANEKESLDYEEFMDFQSHCAEKGITVIPEIEAPGHALAITQWQPQIAFSKTEDLLNLSHPLTLPTMKRIWSEFLPWFQTKEIHIGADEYNSTLADDYIDFVNDLSEYILQESGKKTRVWGTLEPSPTGKELNQERLIMQHWQYTQDDPIALLQNFSVINSQDWWAYTTLKNDHSPISPAPYPLSTNVSRLLHFSDPFDSTSPQWSPSLFNQTNQDPNLQAKPNDPNLKGSVVALWNDNGQNATTQLEAFNAGREGIPIYASRTWSGERGERLDISNETQLFSNRDLLINLIPDQNLDRKLKKPHQRFENGSSLIKFDERTLKKKIGHGSVGLPFSMKIEYVSSGWSLNSEDGRLNMTKEGILTFTSDGIINPLRNVSENDAMSIRISDPNSIGRIWSMNQTESSHQEVVFPVGEVSNHHFKSKPELVELELKTDRKYGTRAYLGGRFVGRFEVLVYGGHNVYTSWSQMAFVAPVNELWEERKGSVVELEVRRDLPSSS